MIDTTEYVYAHVRYIHLNPVVGRLVRSPEDWQFSNYPEWIGVRNKGLFDPKFREMFFSSPDEYEKFVLSEIPNAMERTIAKYYLD